VARKKTARHFHTDRLPGGLADQRLPEEFDPAALHQGIHVEREHTRDDRVALEIAMDHLTEDPDYYSKLAKMENSSRQSNPPPERYDMSAEQVRDDWLILQGPEFVTGKKAAINRLTRETKLAIQVLEDYETVLLPPLSTKAWRKVGERGKGSFGAVALWQHRMTGLTVAVKAQKVMDTPRHQERLDLYWRELQGVILCAHPNISQILGFYLPGAQFEEERKTAFGTRKPEADNRYALSVYPAYADATHLVSALADDGPETTLHKKAIHFLGGRAPLYAWVRENLAANAPDEDRAVATALAASDAVVLTKLAATVAYMAKKGVVHRDFRDDNIVLRKAGNHLEPVVIDFGMARFTGIDKAAIMGPGFIMPPEILSHAVGNVWADHTNSSFDAPPSPLLSTLTSSKTDVFQFGTLLYQYFSGTKGFYPYDVRSIVEAIQDAHDEQWPHMLPRSRRHHAWLEQAHDLGNNPVSKTTGRRAVLSVFDISEWVNEWIDRMMTHASFKAAFTDLLSTENAVGQPLLDFNQIEAVLDGRIAADARYSFLVDEIGYYLQEPRDAVYLVGLILNVLGAKTMEPVLPLKNMVPKNYLPLIKKCLDPNPTKRITPQQLFVNMEKIAKKELSAAAVAAAKVGPAYVERARQAGGFPPRRIPRVLEPSLFQYVDMPELVENLVADYDDFLAENKKVTAQKLRKNNPRRRTNPAQAPAGWTPMQGTEEDIRKYSRFLSERRSSTRFAEKMKKTGKTIRQPNPRRRPNPRLDWGGLPNAVRQQVIDIVAQHKEKAAQKAKNQGVSRAEFEKKWARNEHKYFLKVLSMYTESRFQRKRKKRQAAWEKAADRGKLVYAKTPVLLPVYREDWTLGVDRIDAPWLAGYREASRRLGPSDPDDVVVEERLYEVREAKFSSDGEIYPGERVPYFVVEDLFMGHTTVFSLTGAFGDPEIITGKLAQLQLDAPTKVEGRSCEELTEPSQQAMCEEISLYFGGEQTKLFLEPRWEGFALTVAARVDPFLLVNVVDAIVQSFNLQRPVQKLWPAEVAEIAGMRSNIVVQIDVPPAVKRPKKFEEHTLERRPIYEKLEYDPQYFVQAPFVSRDFIPSISVDEITQEDVIQGFRPESALSFGEAISQLAPALRQFGMKGVPEGWELGLDKTDRPGLIEEKWRSTHTLYFVRKDGSWMVRISDNARGEWPYTGARWTVDVIPTEPHPTNPNRLLISQDRKAFFANPMLDLQEGTPLAYKHFEISPFIGEIEIPVYDRFGHSLLAAIVAMDEKKARTPNPRRRRNPAGWLLPAAYSLTSAVALGASLFDLRQSLTK
jgi:serine/threonine protein kinase